jgi:outer membrane lipoprotein-sorting protein
MNRLKSRLSRPFPALLASALAVTVAGGLVAPALPALAQGGALPAAPAPDQSDLDSAVAAIRAISTLQANFVQTDRNGQRTSGVLTLKRPGKIRFQYEKSVPMLIVSDGRALTLIDYEVKQVQRWPIRNSPLGALLDPDRDIARYGMLRPTGNDEVVSVEVRDPKKPEYGTITMILVRKPAAPGGMELYSWVSLDSQNTRTVVRLSGHRYGMHVPDSTFKYRDPRPAVGGSTRR